MVRFQLRVDQVVVMLQCTSTLEARQNINADQIVEKSLEELKKITQECAMLRMSRGDDVFEMGRNLLNPVSRKRKPKIDAETTNKNNTETATGPWAFKSPANKRRRLIQD
jgi:hypothetical protein